jgi:glycosyltransferase involved in cell wall biosynthesis
MKLEILIFIDWFLPGYKAGGPIQSISNLTTYLHKHYNISIVTSNKDLGALKPYENIVFNEWVKKPNYRVIYLDIENQTMKRYKALFKEKPYSAVYFNSLFSVKFSLLPLIALRNNTVKKILAPRGMLGEGALQIKKYKKMVFLNMCKLFNFHKKIIWHATSEVEAFEIQNKFGSIATINIAANLSSKMEDLPKFKAKSANRLNVFFLSRITTKKNLKFALNLLKQVNDTIHIDFTIIGTVEDKGYWEDCKTQIGTLPNHIKVNYLGEIPNQKIPFALRNQHVLLLPTKHENFGHVIMESWQNACPVIISEHTPWKDLEMNSIGYDINLTNSNKFIESITTFAAMDQSAFEVWSKASFYYAQAFCNDPLLIEANINLFE